MIAFSVTSCSPSKNPGSSSVSSKYSSVVDSGQSVSDEEIIIDEESTTSLSSKVTSKETGKTSAIEQTPIGTGIPKLSPSGKVIVCIPWNSKSPWVVNWTKAYKKIYNLTPEYRIVDPRLLPTRLAAWKQSGDSPDIVFGDISTEWPLLVNKNLVDPIDKVININDNFWKTVKPAIDASNVDGKPYMIISDMAPFTGITYSKKLFKDAGLEDPRSLYYKGKWTWEKFTEYAKKFTKLTGKIETSTFGFTDGYLEGLVATCGKDYITATSKGFNINLDDPAIVRVMEYINNLGIKGENVMFKTPDQKTMHDYLVSGKIAMYVGPNIQLEWPAELKSGLLSWAPTPKNTKEGSKHYEGFNATGFFLCKGAKNPIAGVAYAQAVRSLSIPSINPDARNQGKADYGFTDEDYALLDYRVQHNTPVFMDFRRLQPDYYYWSLWGPGVYEGKSWAAVVNEFKPVLQEAINKLK